MLVAELQRDLQFTLLWWDCQDPCTCDELGLGEDDLLCDACLPLIQLLTNAGNHTKTALQRVSCLLTNQLIKHRQMETGGVMCCSSIQPT